LPIIFKEYTTNTQNYPRSVAFYDTQLGNETGLFYNAPEPTCGMDTWTRRMHSDVNHQLAVLNYVHCSKFT